MGLSLLKSIVLSVRSLNLVQFCWTGWKVAGSNPLLVGSPRASQALHVARVENDGWIDFFLAQPALDNSRRRSILDSPSHIALHYDVGDSYELFNTTRPSAEIPQHLWHALKQDLKTEYQRRERHSH